MDVLQNLLTEVTGTGIKPLQNSQKFRTGTKTLYRYPGHCETGRVQNLKKFGVRVLLRSYRVCRCSGYGYKCLHRTYIQKFSVGYFPGEYPGYGSVGLPSTAPDLENIGMGLCCRPSTNGMMRRTVRISLRCNCAPICIKSHLLGGGGRTVFFQLQCPPPAPLKPQVG